MRYTVKDTDLRAMSEGERETAWAKLIAATQQPHGDNVRELDEQIRACEAQHGIDSATMRQRVRDRALPESWEICQWLMLLNRRALLVTLASRDEQDGGSAPRAHH
jgi:hypothetical protein